MVLYNLQHAVIAVLMHRFFICEAAGATIKLTNSAQGNESCVHSLGNPSTCVLNNSLPNQHLQLTAVYKTKKIMKGFKNSSIDTLIDFVIDVVRHEIIKKGDDKINIPDIHESFHKRVGPIKIKGAFEAKKGWFKSLASLYRTEEITVARSGSILTITAGFGLKTMVMGYDHYKAKFEHLGPNGKIKGEVDHNSIEVKLSVDITGSNCKINLSSLKFKEFSKLKIHMTGLGKLSWIFSKVVTWITNMFNKKIIHSAEKELSNNLIAVLSRIQCHY